MRRFCSTFILLQDIPGDGGGKAGERDGEIDGRPVGRHSSPHWAEKKEILLTCRGTTTTQLFGNVRQQMANSKRPSRSEKGEGKGERRRKPLRRDAPTFPPSSRDDGRDLVLPVLSLSLSLCQSWQTKQKVTFPRRSARGRVTYHRTGNHATSTKRAPKSTGFRTTHCQKHPFTSRGVRISFGRDPRSRE